MGSCVAIVIVNFGSNTGKCTDKLDVSSVHVHSGFPTEKVEQMIMTSFYDVTMISHAIGGGNYIWEANMSLGAVIWVFGTEQLGQLLRSHRPSTLAILVSLMEQEYNLDELCVFFINLHVPRPFWELFS